MVVRMVEEAELLELEEMVVRMVEVEAVVTEVDAESEVAMEEMVVMDIHIQKLELIQLV